MLPKSIVQNTQSQTADREKVYNFYSNRHKGKIYNSQSHNFVLN